MEKTWNAFLRLPKGRRRDLDNLKYDSDLNTYTETVDAMILFLKEDDNRKKFVRWVNE